MTLLETYLTDYGIIIIYSLGLILAFGFVRGVWHICEKFKEWYNSNIWRL